MRDVPFDFGTIHFVGIGGIGMSGIAEVMHNLGYVVQGSDVAAGPNVKRLRDLGVEIFVGHAAANVAEAQAIVISTAIPDDNAEVVAARENKIPVVRRADMLAELMRLKWCVSVAGTHGKTTTTSMVAAVMDAGGLDPTVINGGIINAYGTNARIGESDWMVVEADESDGTFTRLPATFAIVTNIDPEHLDFYGDFAAVKAAFHTFVERVPFYGAAALCIDDPDVQNLMAEIIDRRLISYGLSPQAEVRGVNVSFTQGVATFDVEVSERVTGTALRIDGFSLPMPGLYNVQNALAAITIGLALDLGPDQLRQAFSGFGGVKRRFTRVGVVDNVTIVDDYGHHPVEISAVLAAARGAFDGNVIAVVQPHRYTRLQSLFEDFCTCMHDADTVLVAPVYPAGETPIPGFDRDSLVQGLKARGHRHVVAVDGEGDLASLVRDVTSSGDIVICLGAGSITTWANNLPDAMRKLDDKGGEA